MKKKSILVIFITLLFANSCIFLSDNGEKIGSSDSFVISITTKPQVQTIIPDNLLDLRRESYGDFLNGKNLGDIEEILSNNSGISIFLRENNSWGASIKYGTNKLLYRPTLVRQNLFDGKSHTIDIAFDRQKNIIKFFYDKENTAVFFMPLSPTGSISPKAIKILNPQLIESFSITKTNDINSTINPKINRLEPDDNLKILSFNIWHGGVSDSKISEFEDKGDYAGSGLKPLDPGTAVARVIDLIRISDADIVGLQETYGSGEAIADALGFTYCEKIYPSGNNISIVSRFEIEEILETDPQFNLLATKIRLNEEKSIVFFSIWIHWLPDITTPGILEGKSEEQIIEEEKPRLIHINQILDAARKYYPSTDTTPMLIVGDFNSPSHLDCKIKWPVSRLMQENGFTDSYREVNPDVKKFPGITWSPRGDKSRSDQQRIDFIYYKGYGIKAVKSKVIERYEGNIFPEYFQYPSDHAAVLSEFTIN
ncbi:MAG: endonuclease/exonuclease/phosphatase family protein [Spirochaetales bacterium]|nr:endonuclease/exonuclease/phosphatase family protein [Spirochaetales bacterium]